jgi:hypothetical protein
MRAGGAAASRSPPWEAIVLDTMPEQRARVDVDALRRDVSIEDALAAFAPEVQLRRAGRELVGLSPFKSERTPSFTVSGNGLWHCFATDQGGDVIRLVERLTGRPFREAAEMLAERVSGRLPTEAVDPAERARRQAARERAAAERRAREASEAADRVAAARRIWQETRRAEGTPVELYLALRGIDLAALEAAYGRAIPPFLRYHPEATCRRDDGAMHTGPAMVGWLQAADGSFAGIHRTFLAPDGDGKARGIGASKRTLGAVWGSHGALMPAPERRAVVGEGYETTLAVIAALAARGERVTALSAVSLGNLAGGGLGEGAPHPRLKGRRLPSVRPDPERPGLVLPGGIARVVILEDADGSDPEAVRARVVRAAAKFRAAGLRVSVASPEMGCDFNDMAQGGL